jgi:dTDP-4-dehydrorhamnose 3,5-epimerase
MGTIPGMRELVLAHCAGRVRAHHARRALLAQTIPTFPESVMIFTETKLKGAFVIDIEKRVDSRGFFARVFCQNEATEHGLKPMIAQANIAFNIKKGTLRGMHFQYPPAAETKVVRCTRGAILDIIVDLRPESPTYLEHIAVELTADNHRALYVPERFAHGYQTLEDETETSYQVGEFYAPGMEGGLAHDDPRLGLVWPLPVTEISPKDAAWAPLDEIEAGLKRRMSVLLTANADG